MVVEVKGGKLVIRPDRQDGLFRSGWHFHGTVDVTVTVPKLRGAAIAGSGDMKVNEVKGDEFDGSVAGSGGLDVGKLDVQTLKLSVAGSGGSQGRRRPGAKRRIDIAGRATSTPRACRRRPPTSRSPGRAISRSTPAARLESASWARATSMSPAAPNARSARPARATSAALKASLTMVRQGAAHAHLPPRRRSHSPSPRPPRRRRAISESPASTRSASTGPTRSR